MKPFAFMLLVCSALALCACAANHEVGMCTELGLCPEPEGCKDGYKDDGTECDESATGYGKPKQTDHNFGGMTGTGSDDDSQ